MFIEQGVGTAKRLFQGNLEKTQSWPNQLRDPAQALSHWHVQIHKKQEQLLTCVAARRLSRRAARSSALARCAAASMRALGMPVSSPVSAFSAADNAAPERSARCRASPSA